MFGTAVLTHVRLASLLHHARRASDDLRHDHTRRWPLGVPNTLTDRIGTWTLQTIQAFERIEAMRITQACAALAVKAGKFLLCILIGYIQAQKEEPFLNVSQLSWAYDRSTDAGHREVD